MDALHWGEASPHIHPIVADVADTLSVERAFLEVDRHLSGRSLDAVINAAAISLPGVIEMAPIDFHYVALGPCVGCHVERLLHVKARH